MPAFQLDTLLKHIEAISGLRICLKTFDKTAASGSVLDSLPPMHVQHYSAFCMAVKKRATQRCIQCDLRDIPTLALEHELPFIHLCHAGATEIIIPIRPAPKSLVALGYIGQFRQDETQPRQLPLLTQAQITHLLTLASLLQSHLIRMLEHSRSPLPSPRGRQQLILHFLKHNLRRDPSLSEMARNLSVSTSRAGHLVKEVTGSSYIELKLGLKIASAKHLLSATHLTIEAVANETGFQDPRYFHRIFRRETGLPPGQWRRENQSQTHLAP